MHKRLGQLHWRLCPQTALDRRHPCWEEGDPYSARTCSLFCIERCRSHHPSSPLTAQCCTGYRPAKGNAKNLCFHCFRKGLWTCITKEQPFHGCLSPLSSLTGTKQSALGWEDIQHFKYLCLLLVSTQLKPSISTSAKDSTATIKTLNTCASPRLLHCCLPSQYRNDFQIKLIICIIYPSHWVCVRNWKAERQ